MYHMCSLCARAQASSSGGVDGQSVALLEGQLTWLVHIVGAILRGRLNQSSADTQVRPCACKAISDA